MKDSILQDRLHFYALTGSNEIIYENKMFAGSIKKSVLSVFKEKPTVIGNSLDEQNVQLSLF